ncbi:hypothetical protein FQN57_004689 [Myotisia sp. PD_48]|nr:hypothetical protein FQN57_004689 [Myotisia sp. PD_48]
MAPPPSKRRKTAAAARIEEISFDPEARQEYLTGFHKRKLQRAKHAQGIAEKKAKEERLEQRRKIREERKADFQRALDQHRAQMREANGLKSESDDSSEEEERSIDDPEWGGITEPPPVDYEAEYIDEDKYTTVTVEEVEPTREGLQNILDTDIQDNRGQEREEKLGTDKTGLQSGGGNEEPDSQTDPKSKKRIWKKDNPNKKENKRKKKRDFKYESPAERKLNRYKQKEKNRKQANARKGK